MDYVGSNWDEQEYISSSHTKFYILVCNKVGRLLLLTNVEIYLKDDLKT